MRENVRLRAAERLMTTHISGENMLLPKIYIVGSRTYWFYYAALRAAYGTPFEVEKMTIEEAFEVYTGKPSDMLDKQRVSWEFNQRGEIFEGKYLFCDNKKVKLNK